MSLSTVVLGVTNSQPPQPSLSRSGTGRWECVNCAWFTATRLGQTLKSKRTFQEQEGEYKKGFEYQIQVKCLFFFIKIDKCLWFICPSLHDQDRNRCDLRNLHTLCLKQRQYGNYMKSYITITSIVTAKPRSSPFLGLSRKVVLLQARKPLTSSFHSAYYPSSPLLPVCHPLGFRVSQPGNTPAIRLIAVPF